MKIPTDTQQDRAPENKHSDHSRVGHLYCRSSPCWEGPKRCHAAARSSESYPASGGREEKCSPLPWGCAFTGKEAAKSRELKLAQEKAIPSARGQGVHKTEGHLDFTPSLMDRQHTKRDLSYLSWKIIILKGSRIYESTLADESLSSVLIRLALPV